MDLTDKENQGKELILALVKDITNANWVKIKKKEENKIEQEELDKKNKDKKTKLAAKQEQEQIERKTRYSK
ncbi:MAG: hypothetical protein AAF770_01620 [Bacteroidota bacterium]